MARRADVVIGSAFGDEGKGLLTDVLAARQSGETLVVRFNGGAQAGHTVATPEGQRHVFSHFGSGTFAGSATFLSRFFVVNPILFHREREQLNRLGLSAKVLVDRRAVVTTPFDMLVNTALEKRRGPDRHGSCGIGFGETVGRNEHGAFALTIADLAGPSAGWKLRAIRDEWLPRRLTELGLELSEEERGTLLSDGLLARFMEDVAGMLDSITLCDEASLRAAPHVVFEGAQGLLLDQEMGFFPHVTRSHTGLRNVSALIEPAGITSLDIHYVLRPYLTRHGAGPLPGELPARPYGAIVDDTNIPNPWQGSLRFGLGNLDLLRSSVARDLAHAGLPKHIVVRKSVAITCLDQIDGEVRFCDRGAQAAERPEAFVHRCMDAIGARDAHVSRGPTRATCTLISDSRERTCNPS